MKAKKILISGMLIFVLAAAAFAIYESALASTTTSPELVGHWEFNEGSGSIAVDSSENDNDGTLNGPTRVDGALDFDGKDDVVTVPNSPSLNVPSVTMALWVNWGSLNNEISQGLFAKGDDKQRQIWGWTHNGRFESEIDEGRICRSETPLTTGRWYHVAVTYDGSSTRLYLNGTLDTTCTQASGEIFTDDGPLLIGRLPDPHYHFDGQIDDVRLYNYALSSAEVTELASAMTPEPEPEPTPEPTPEPEECSVEIRAGLDDLRRLWYNASSPDAGAVTVTMRSAFGNEYLIDQRTFAAPWSMGRQSEEPANQTGNVTLMVKLMSEKGAECAHEKPVNTGLGHPDNTARALRNGDPR